MEIATLVVQAVTSLAWPAVVAFVLWLFRDPLGRLLTSGTLTVKGPGGLQISTSARAAAADDLQQAAAARSVTFDPGAARSRVDEVAATANAAAPPRILWVDDEPSGNRLECAALTRLGMVVDQVVSTDAALDAVLRSAPFDVIVSDMGRPESTTAGYDLLGRLRAAGVRTPFVVYSASGDPSHDDQAVAAGALGSTNDPGRLLDLIIQALRRQPPPGAGG